METPNITDKERNGFTFYRSFRDAVTMTAPDEQHALYLTHIHNYEPTTPY